MGRTTKKANIDPEMQFLAGNNTSMKTYRIETDWIMVAVLLVVMYVFVHIYIYIFFIFLFLISFG